MYPIETFLSQTERVALMPGPTPLHPMQSFQEHEEVTVYIKRDDMTGIGPGGNKVRSLEFILGEAVAGGCDKILTAGPEQSNLCSLTAAACAKMDLPCELFFNSAEPERKEGNLLLARLLGAKLHFLGPCDGDERNRLMEEQAVRYTHDGQHPFVVRNGATTGRGALGYTAAIVELVHQCEAIGLKHMTIFAPGGNGGVAAGLIYGNEQMGRPFRIVIVSVEDDRATLIDHIGKTIRDTESITGLPMEVALEDATEVTDAYRGSGWGQNTPESEQAIFDFASEEGIFIENVYNSKVLVGMRDWIEAGKVSGPVCYLHTGGLGSLFAQY